MKAWLLSLLFTWCTHANCAPYGESLARAIEDAARANNLPPTLLVAVAWHESRFRPWARSETDFGVFQLNLRSKWGRRAFWECMRPGLEQEQCIYIQADEAAWLLRWEIDRCGSTMRGLAAYNTGSCTSKTGLRYARRVLRVLRRFR